MLRPIPIHHMKSSECSNANRIELSYIWYTICDVVWLMGAASYGAIVFTETPVTGILPRVISNIQRRKENLPQSQNNILIIWDAVQFHFNIFPSQHQVHLNLWFFFVDKLTHQMQWHWTVGESTFQTHHLRLQSSEQLESHKP